MQLLNMMKVDQSPGDEKTGFRPSLQWTEVARGRHQEQDEDQKKRGIDGRLKRRLGTRRSSRHCG